MTRHPNQRPAGVNPARNAATQTPAGRAFLDALSSFVG